MAATLESALQGDSICISRVNPPVSLPGVHSLPPSPALTHSDTPTPTPTPNPIVDTELSAEALYDNQLPPNADTNNSDEAGLVSNNLDSSFSQQIKNGLTSDIVADKPSSVSPPSVVLGDASPSDPETSWQITDVHSLQSQEQAAWGDAGVDTEHAGNNEAVDAVGCHHFSYTAAYAQPQQPTESCLPETRLVCLDLDTGQGNILHTPSTLDPQRYPQPEAINPDQPKNLLSLGPGLPVVKTGRPGTSGNGHFQRLFQKGSGPDFKSGHIDHNLKPLQITHNFSDGKNPTHSGTGILKFRRSTKPVYQGPHRKNAALLMKGDFHMAEKNTSSSKSACCLGPHDNGENGHFGLASNQHMQKDNNSALHVGFDGSAGKIHSYPTDTNSSYEDFVNTSLEHHDYSLQPLSVEQYLFDCNDLPQFANIPTEDDLGGDMFELTPSIPPDALPTYSLQQRGLHEQNVTSTPGPADPAHKCLQMSLNSSGTIARYCGMSTESFQAYDTCKAVYASNSTVDNSACVDEYHSGTIDECHSVNDYVTRSFKKGSRSSKTAVIPAALTPTGPDMHPSAEPAEEPPTMWSAVSDLAPPSSAHNFHRSDPVADALMSALGVDMHVSLTKMHSRGSPCSEPSPYPLNDDTGMEYSSTLLSPPVTPRPERESGYLTADDTDTSPANFSWPQHEGLCGGDPDSSYTSYGHQSYTEAGNRGRGGGNSVNIPGPYVHHDLYHQTSVPSLIKQEGGQHVQGSGSSFPHYCDIMQLHPSVAHNQELSVHYIPHQYSDPSLHPYPPSTAQPVTPVGRKRRQGRGRGRAKDQTPGRIVQIQSDQITSSLRAQTGSAPKRTYRRRSCKAALDSENPSGHSSQSRRRSSKAKQAAAEHETSPSEKKIRHNEPLNQKAVNIMTEWYRRHEENPYPTKEEKEQMAVEGGITTMQVKSWFANKRNRSNNTRPKVQKREMEEKLMQIYRKAAGHVPDGNNAYIIKELSQIIHTFDRDSDNHGPMDAEEEEEEEDDD